MPQVHSILYPSSRRRPNSPVPIGHARDSLANTELRRALLDRGYAFGESLLSFPPPGKAQYDRFGVDALAPVDLSFVRPQDLLFQTTRPPQSEAWHDDRKKIEPANTFLEAAILTVCERYFRRCARSYLCLTRAAAAWLRAGKENRAAISFHQTGCDYSALADLAGETASRTIPADRTAAYLLRVDELWPGGPGFLVSFGMNAWATAAWCTLLRLRHADLLENRGLTVVELKMTDVPARPATNAWALGWTAEPVLEMDGELPPRPGEDEFFERFMLEQRRFQDGVR